MLVEIEFFDTTTGGALKSDIFKFCTYWVVMQICMRKHGCQRP